MCCRDDLAFHLIALFIIAYIYTAVQVVVLPPWLGWGLAGTLCTAVLNCLCVLLLYSYFSAAYTNPGSVPAGYTPPEPDHQAGGKEDKLLHEKTYCSVCAAPRPPLDHHCPWINNCVGHANHRYFILFLAYVTVGLSFCLVLSVWRLILLIPDGGDVNEAVGTLAIIGVAIFLEVLVLLGVGTLLVFQAKLVARNMTTIESWAFDDAAALARRKGRRLRHKYDLGTRANLLAFFGGAPPSLWWLPRATTTDGLSFKTHPHAGAGDNPAAWVGADRHEPA